jgi:predicted NBD/HSP70 family sugar kinase
MRTLGGTVGGPRQISGGGDLRQGNLTSILRYVRDNGSSSRHDIALGCGLGISTMTDLIAELRSRRLVRELEPIRRPGAGRPTRPIALDGEPWCGLGVHVELDVVRFRAVTIGGREVWSAVTPIDLSGSPAEADRALRATLLEQVAALPTNTELLAVEVGVPGHVARDRGMVTSPAMSWQGYPLQAVMLDALAAAQLPQVPVSISNDCHLAALHATRIEVGLPGDSVAVYIGGVRRLGSGLIVNGEIFRGARGAAGDLGHHNVDPRGRPCWCGRQGCLETLVGLRHLLEIGGLATAAEAAQIVTEDPRAAVRELKAAAAAQQPAVVEALAAAGSALGTVIDDLMGALNPDAAILGGYLTPLTGYLMPEIEKRTALRSTADSATGTKILALESNEERVVGGAALAARDACINQPLQLTRVLI